jgi:mannose-1-phosphate guanylyltransferase
MNAILLAAGFGTRLRPLTENLPKCLVQIKGKQLLQIWLEKLSRINVQKILVNTHYLPEQVEDFVNANEAYRNVELSHEEKLLGTAGTLFKNIEFYGNEEGMLLHADNYCEEDLNGLVRAHKLRPKYCVITMLVFRAKNANECGIVELDKSGVVQKFHEKINNPPSNLASGAIFILSKDFIMEYKKIYNGQVDFSKEIIPLFIGKIYIYEVSGNFVDIGNPEAYRSINE